MSAKPRARRFLSRALSKRTSDRLRLSVEGLLYPPDVSPEDRALYESVTPYTMTSVERVITLAGYVRHLVAQRVPGAFVECGVWRGGSSMCIARTLLQLGVTRELHLFDTFSGMSAPTDDDLTLLGKRAADLLRATPREQDDSLWCWASLADVRRNLLSTGYPEARIHLVEGKVEDTIPDAAPPEIALLRLDTDWYESTRHELEHLYPRVSPGGIIVVDDYGHWAGARKAVDEFLSSLPNAPVMHRIDYTCRVFVKP